MSPKEMLAAVLKRGKLKLSEKEALEDVWDRMHRYGRLTPKQKAWVERVYFAQKLDRPSTEFMPRSGFITHPSVRKTVLVTSVQMLRDACPFIPPGSKQFRKVELFFRRGGEVLKIKPEPEKERESLPSAP